MNADTPSSGRQEPHESRPASAQSAQKAGARLVAFASSRGRYYAVVLAFFCVALLVSNISATKVIAFFPMGESTDNYWIVADGGAFLFPFVYIMGDVISEVYGFAAARKAVIMGFVSQLGASLIFLLVIIAPPGPGYDGQEAFAAVLGFYPRIVAASLAGYAVGQMLNAFVLVRIKRRMGERALWVRLLGSTGVGEAADTVIFCTVAFAGVIPGGEFIKYVLFGFVYKVAVEVLFLPVTQVVIRWFKKRAGTYSIETDAERRAEGARV